MATALLSAAPALAQDWAGNLRVSHISRSTFTVRWERGVNSRNFEIYLKTGDADKELVAITDSTSRTFKYLTPGETYTVIVQDGPARLSISVNTKRKPEEPARHEDTPNTCQLLPSRITVTGHMENTRCQVVDARGVGRSDLIKRGIIDAVDIWNYVPENVEVCFQDPGYLALLDADYAPRMVMELEPFQREGRTCGVIDRRGTVVLLASPASPAAPAAIEAPATVETPAEIEEPAPPIFEPIALADCQIKLVTTLFLRAEPAGEIISLVWLNSEVPAYEINGYWYKIEFEGVTGYISRYHREVLSGNCG